MPLDSWLFFAAFFAGLVAIDFIITRGREVSVRRSVTLTAWYIGIALGFSAFIYETRGASAAAQYLTVFSLEKVLSMDNLLVIYLIFNYFGVPADRRHEALLWGLSGAVVFRVVIIAGGISLMGHMQWLLYGCAAFLLYSGGKMMLVEGDDGYDASESGIVAAVRKYAGVRTLYYSIWPAVIAVELSDIMFAADSIPASLGVSQDVFVVVSANLMAVLGLRSLYHAVAAGIDALDGIGRYIGAVLMLVGASVFARPFIQISDMALAGAVFLILGTGTFACRPKKTT